MKVNDVADFDDDRFGKRIFIVTGHLFFIRCSFVTSDSAAQTCEQFHRLIIKITIARGNQPSDNYALRQLCPQTIMKDKFANPWQTISTRQVYDNPWIRVREDQVIRPDGEPGIYGVIHFKNKAIGIVPVDADGNIHLVGQFRYTLNSYSWEIPEGGCPDDEEPLETAKRELMEEMGLAAREWKQLGTAHLSNSVCDEEAIYYLATDLTYGEANPEGTEKLERRCVPVSEALRMIQSGEMTDALSILAILHYLHLSK
jgi:8-oxo-dGTP pyrophosphatase MutT (NUDIX family)